MVRILAFLFALSLGSGCATTTDRALFHAINTVDAVQTSQYKHNDCLVEGSQITRQVIGDEPGEIETAAYFLGLAWLYEEGHKRFSEHAWWRPVSWLLVGYRARTVVENQRALLRECHR